MDIVHLHRRHRIPSKVPEPIKNVKVIFKFIDNNRPNQPGMFKKKKKTLGEGLAAGYIF